MDMYPPGLLPINPNFIPHQKKERRRARRKQERAREGSKREREEEEGREEKVW